MSNMYLVADMLISYPLCLHIDILVSSRMMNL